MVLINIELVDGKVIMNCYKHTEDVTDWADLKWSKIWRKNLSDLINETNTALGMRLRI